MSKRLDLTGSDFVDYSTQSQFRSYRNHQRRVTSAKQTSQVFEEDDIEMTPINETLQIENPHQSNPPNFLIENEINNCGKQSPSNSSMSFSTYHAESDQ